MLLRSLSGLSRAFCYLCDADSRRALFVVSLIAILVQDVWWFGIVKAHDRLALGNQIMPIVVIIIAFLLIWFSRNCTKRGWLR